MGVPSDEQRLLIGQDLVQFRLATCFLLSLVAAIIVLLDAEQEEIMSQCGMCQQMYRLGVTGASAAQSHSSARPQYIDLPLHVMLFQISQNQVLRLEGIITEQFAALAFAHSVIPGRIVSLVLVLLVSNRSATALPDFFDYRFDELSPCLSVFASLWVCAHENLPNKLEPLSLCSVELILGRGLAQLIPS